MSTDRENQPTYTKRVPWQPAPLRLVPHRGHDERLYVYCDEDGITWWSDGYAAFRGHAPAYLRAAYLATQRPVDAAVTMVPPVFALARIAPVIELELPVASYQVHSPALSAPLPIAVFAARGREREIHVDARYLAYARERFAGCTFWRGLHDTCVAVRAQPSLAIVGIIPARRPLGLPRARSTA